MGNLVKKLYWPKMMRHCRMVHREYEKLKGNPKYTLKWLLYTYFESAQFLERSQRTQKDYRLYTDKLIQTPLKNDRLFGDVDLVHITAKVIRRYLDNYPAKTAANRHVQFLKSVFNWGKERYDAVTNNPCLGVKLHTEKPRERYIKDNEYELVKNIAQASGSPYIVIFMELAYLCRARWSEIASLKRADLEKDGLQLKRNKGSENELTLWSPRLRHAVNMTKAFNANVISRYLVHDKQGFMIKRMLLIQRGSALWLRH